MNFDHERQRKELHLEIWFAEPHNGKSLQLHPANKTRRTMAIVGSF